MDIREQDEMYEVSNTIEAKLINAVLRHISLRIPSGILLETSKIEAEIKEIIKDLKVIPELTLIGDEEIREVEKEIPTPEEWRHKPDHGYWNQKKLIKAQLTHINKLIEDANGSKGGYLRARGVAPRQPGAPPAEEIIRQLRDAKGE